ncbi:MAG: RNA-binding transcriptional accessory protein, partial [Armatimonadia bacterium]
PAQVVKVAEQVQVTVLEVDLERGRIALSMKTNPGQPRKQGPRPEGRAQGNAQGKGNQDRRPERKQGHGQRQGGQRQERPAPAPATAFARAFAELEKDTKGGKK